MFRVLWQKVASPTCHPLRQRMASTELDLNLIHGSLNLHKSVPKRHLDRFSFFAQYVGVTTTQKNTRATSVAIAISN